MVNGPLAGKLLLFAMPLMLSTILQLLFNAADVVVVGRFAGKEALAAVGSTTSLINLFVGFFTGFSVGTNVVVARDLGSGRTDEVSRSVHTSIALALGSGLFLLAVGLLFSRQMLVWMSSPADVIDLAALYMRIYFCGMPANLLYNFGAAVLRAQGDTQRPLYFLATAGVINVVLNLFFVISLQMSVAGVALATIISQYISAALVLWTLIKQDGVLKLDLRRLRLDRPTALRILRVGFPAGIQSLVFSISNVVIQSTINSFGSTVVAGNSAAVNIEGFIYSGVGAVYQACLTFTSQNYGAGKCKRVDQVLLLSMLYAAGLGLIMGQLASLFAPELASLYAPGEADVIAHAVTRLRIIGGTYIICGFLETPVGTLRGLGYSILPTAVSIAGACGLRLLWVWLLFPLNPTLEMLYAAYPVTWAITATGHYIFLAIVRRHAYHKAESMHSIT